MHHPNLQLGSFVAFAVASSLGCSSGSGHGASASTSGANAPTPNALDGSLAGSSADSASCQPGATLTGTPYSIAKSRFAFGSPPVEQDAGALVRWVGSDGVVGIFPNGYAIGSLDAWAPQQNLPDWSSDETALGAHVVEYFASMGAATCQVGNPGINGSGSGVGSIDGSIVFTPGPSTVDLPRMVDGIRVVESIAYARFDSQDETTSEGFYWPEVPAAVVTAARSFRDRLADPAALAAYKALPPSSAQGDGQVVIHHTSGASMSPFQSATTYDVEESGGRLGGGAQVSFDANGQPVSTAW